MNGEPREAPPLTGSAGVRCQRRAARGLSILVLAPFLPWPLFAGNRVRLFNVLEELATRHAVTLLVQVPPVRGRADTEAFLHAIEPLGVDVHLVEHPNRNIWTRAWMRSVLDVRRATVGGVIQEVHLNTPLFRRAVRRLADSRPFDVAVTTYFCCGTPEILESGIPVVCNASDILWMNAAAAQGLRGRRLERLKRREAATYRRCAGVICVHERDAEIVSGMVDGAVPVLAMAHSRSRHGLSVAEPRAGAGSVVGFYGHMGSAMNRAALAFLVSQVWPLVQIAEPEAFLWVFGGDGADLEPGLLRASVSYLGTCPDLPGTLAGIDVVVLPLRFGSGIKGRVLECMEIGVPVVGTPSAFEGIPIEPGVHALVGIDAASLAAGCVTLLRDGQLRRQVSESGRAFFARRYAWEQTYGSIHSFIEGIVDAC